jgi:tetratricopeptide (TPR) repeat protein
MKFLLKSSLVTSVLLAASFSFQAIAKVPPEKAEQVKALEKARGGKVMGQRTGKKVLKAFDLYNEDKVDEALAVLLEINPKTEFDKATVNRYIGSMYAGLDGKAAEAIKYLELAVKTDKLPFKDHSEALRNLAQLAYGEKDYENVIKYYNEYLAFSLDEDPKAYLSIANAYFELKQYKNVTKPAQLSKKYFAKWDKPNINPYVLIMASYYELKNMPAATKTLEDIVKAFPEEGRYWVQLGGFYALQEQNDKALSIYRLANKQGFLTKGIEYKRLAQFYSNAGVPYKAAVVQEEQISKGVIKKDEKSLSVMAQTFQNAKEFKKAAKYYGEAARLDNSADLYRKQGIALMASEDYKGAVEAFEKSLENKPKRAGAVYLALGEAEFYLENWKKSHQAFTKAKESKRSARTAKGWLGYVADTARRKGVTL